MQHACCMTILTYVRVVSRAAKLLAVYGVGVTSAAYYGSSSQDGVITGLFALQDTSGGRLDITSLELQRIEELVLGLSEPLPIALYKCRHS